MITPTQMRAARAMLDVSQGHVAEYLGIAANTLSKIESGQSDVAISRMSDIQRFYEREGIEFTDNDGVARKSGGVETYKGHSGLCDFLDDVYGTLKDGGQSLVNNVDEGQFLKWLGGYADTHMERMKLISGLSFKILIEEGDRNTVASSYAEYRALPRENFGDIPLYMYGDKAAFIVFDKDDVEVFVVKHIAITDYFKERFNKTWAIAREI